jgi:hypothetical protein
MMVLHPRSDAKMPQAFNFMYNSFPSPALVAK